MTNPADTLNVKDLKKEDFVEMFNRSFPGKRERKYVKRNIYRKVAIHEAAHAVMFVFLRLRGLQAVSIIPKGDDGNNGWTLAGQVRLNVQAMGDVWSNASYRKAMLVALASQVEGTQPSKPDSLHAIQIAKNVIKGDWRGSLNRACMTANRLVNGPLKTPIMQLAAILLDEFELDGDEARFLICKLLRIPEMQA